MSTARGRASGFLGSHPLVGVLLLLEALFIVGGVLIEQFASEVAPGSTTTIGHVAGIFGALAVVFAVLGISAGIGYVFVFRVRR